MQNLLNCPFFWFSLLCLILYTHLLLCSDSDELKKGLDKDDGSIAATTLSHDNTIDSNGGNQTQSTTSYDDTSETHEVAWTADFDGEFAEDADLMKQMGLPTSFYPTTKVLILRLIQLLIDV